MSREDCLAGVPKEISSSFSSQRGRPVSLRGGPWLLLTLIAVSAAAPLAAQAWDVKATKVLTRKLDGGKWVATNVFREGEKVRVDCWFSYASFGTLKDMNDWVISFSWDGHRFATTPGSGANEPSNSYLRSAFHQADALGPHKVGCLLNNGGFLPELEVGNNEKTASITVIPLTPYVASVKDRRAGPVAAKPAASLLFGMRGYPEVNLRFAFKPAVFRGSKAVQEATIGETLRIDCHYSVLMSLLPDTSVHLPGWKYRVTVDGVVLAEKPGQTEIQTAPDFSITHTEWKPSTPGSHAISCRLDPLGQISESNESDNEAKLAVKILGKARRAPAAGGFRAVPRGAGATPTPRRGP
jgi:hypothetical protein